MKTQVAFGFHLAATSIYTFAAYYDAYHVSIPGADVPPRNYGGRWKFLTFWDAVLQALFYALCVVVTLHKWVFPQQQRLAKLFNKFIDLAFTIVIFPLGLFVASTFWGLYFWDRELVFPKILDLYFPWWLNQAVHTLIVPTSLIEMICIPHQYVSKLIGIPTLISLASLYLLWTLYLAHFINIWVYPILAILDNAQRTVFFGMIFAFFVAQYCLGEFIHDLTWGTNKPKKHMSKKKK